MSELTITRALFRAVLLTVALVVGVLLLIALRYVLVQVFVAAIIAAGMAPLVTWLCDTRNEFTRRWRPPRALVVLLIYLVCALLLLVLGALTLQAVANEGAVLLIRVPELATTVQVWIDTQLETHPILAQLGLGNLAGGIINLEQYALPFLRQLVTAASMLVGAFGGAITVLFVMFMALYLSVDHGRILEYTIVFVPESRQAQARRVASQIASRLGQSREARPSGGADRAARRQ
jgi:predicted PurR-regulated permease PerM